MLNDRDHLGKLNSKSDEGVFLGYCTNSKAYKIYNMRTHSIVECKGFVHSFVDALLLLHSEMLTRL